MKQKSKTKAKEGAANRSARVYRVNPKLAAEAAKLTAPQAVAVYGVLARNKAGLTAEQILEKLSGNEKFMASRNPSAMVATNLYDLRHGTGCVKRANLILLVGRGADAEKKQKTVKPKAEAGQPASAQ